jgi:parallel beta-helix repeat protein
LIAKIFILVCLVDLLCLTGISSADRTQEQATVSFDGTIYYVGGSGPGNYSNIQDAVNQTSDGDMVFVFAGTYYENVMINRSIELIGENQEATIIDGQEANGHVVILNADEVTVTGFTIQNCGGIPNAAELYVTSENNHIINNTLVCTTFYGAEAIWLWQSSKNTITQNSISHHSYGIWLEYSDDNTISQNDIGDIQEWGIILGNSHYNNVTGNTLTGNDGGIYIRDSNTNTVSGNDIARNRVGVAIIDLDSTSADNTITHNTFVFNTRQASFVTARNSTKRNTWDGNYWNRPMLLPKVIHGSRILFIFPGMPFHLPPLAFSIPWWNVDWHPAKKPL